MKKISIVVPTYNEEENVKPLSEAIINELSINCNTYDYELIFIDNNVPAYVFLRVYSSLKCHVYNMNHLRHRFIVASDYFN